MRPLTINLSILVASSILLVSCFDYHKKNLPPPNGGDVVRAEAYVPVYGADSGDVYKITSAPVRQTIKAGKIYVQGKTLFQVEQLAGVHVINYSNKENPVKLGFIKSRGCSEVAYKNGFLIINNLDDLVFIDVSDINNIKEASRIRHAFVQFYVDQYNNSRPPVSGKYYVCPNYYKGDIVEWKLEKNVKGAYCY